MAKRKLKINKRLQGMHLRLKRAEAMRNFKLWNEEQLLGRVDFPFKVVYSERLKSWYLHNINANELLLLEVVIKHISEKGILSNQDFVTLREPKQK